MIKNTFLFILVFQAFITTAQEDTTHRGSVRINCDNRILDLMDQHRKANLGKQIQGYRLQLYSGERAAAFELKANFIKQFPDVPCNVVYETPDFKTQVGNYRTALEAEAAMQQIWPVFKSAFVVAAKIDLPELSSYAKNE